MKRNTTYRLLFSLFLVCGLVVLFMVFSKKDTSNNLLCAISPSTDHTTSFGQELLSMTPKQKGAHVFGIGNTTDFQAIKDANFEWITLVSWGYQEDFDSPIMTHHNGDSLYIQQHNAHWINKIKMVREAGFKVFFKPHLWVTSPSNGTWRSDIFPTDEKNWELWKESYRNFILRYAKIAEEAKAEMFCLGTEFTRLTLEKPLYWKSLIQEIRTVYSGKLTYAANWYQEYEEITFWNDLDFIGIQAYFPLAAHQYPSVEGISKGWEKYIPTIAAIHKKHNKKVLFTEMGYRSIASSAIKPWDWIEKSSMPDDPFSLETQANCYEAFFNTIWKKDWFAGVHIWQMRSDYKPRKERNDLNFTPQGKPAEHIIAKGFKQKHY